MFEGSEDLLWHSWLLLLMADKFNKCMVCFGFVPSVTKLLFAISWLSEWTEDSLVKGGLIMLFV